MPPWQPSEPALRIVESIEWAAPHDTNLAAELKAVYTTLKILANKIADQEKDQINLLKTNLDKAWQAERDKVKPPSAKTKWLTFQLQTPEEKAAWIDWLKGHRAYRKRVGTAKKALVYKKLDADDLIKLAKKELRVISKQYRSYMRSTKRAGAITRRYHHYNRKYYELRGIWYLTMYPSERLFTPPEKFP